MFTRQELIYLAMGARSLAQRSRADAEKQAWPNIKATHEKAAAEYEALAAKCDRLAVTSPFSPVGWSTPGG